jgi:hypothetical protein
VHGSPISGCGRRCGLAYSFGVRPMATRDV